MPKYKNNEGLVFGPRWKTTIEKGIKWRKCECMVHNCCKNWKGNCVQQFGKKNKKWTCYIQTLTEFWVLSSKVPQSYNKRTFKIKLKFVKKQN